MDNSADRYGGSSYRKWLVAAALVFGIGLVLGVFSPDSIKRLFAGEIAGLKNIASFYVPFLFSTFIFILSKNALSLLLSFILSPLLDIMPLLSLFTNWWLLGFIAVITTEKKGFFFVLLGILPHGIFELPAFFIGEAAALSFGAAVLLAIFKRERRAELPQNLKQNILRLVVALALLVPAAIIETYVTPLLVG